MSEKMTDAQVKHMVERFLSWKLPEDFNPDAGISFKAEFNENTPWPMKHEPMGTNLFDYTQAEAMVRHLVCGLPVSAATEAERAVGEAVYARVAVLMSAEPGTPAAAELEALANLVTRAEAALSKDNAHE